MRNPGIMVCLVGTAALASIAGGCSSGSKIQTASNTFTLEPYQQINLAVSGQNGELLIENRGAGQVAVRVPQDEAAIEPSESYTTGVDGPMIVEFYNASRMPTKIRYTGSGIEPLQMSMLE